MQRRVAVIGGGITGLATAHRLVELDPSIDVRVLEAGGRLGGVLATSRQDGFLIEDAADGFMSSPPAVTDLCRRLGLEQELIEANESCRQALVLSRGRLLPIPLGFQLMAPSRLGPLLSTPILSARGKLRAALELALPRRKDGGDESLQSFVCRRFGRELFERLVQPLVGGIYAGDPRQLSIESTFPRFRQMEREHRSLIRAMLRNSSTPPTESGARYGQFKTLRGGLGTLIDALAARLPPGSIELNAAVAALLPGSEQRWRVQLDTPGRESLEVDGVIVAAPAHQGGRLLAQADAELAAELNNIEYASCAVVALGYERRQIGHPLDGFGFVVPLVEQRMILSCSFSSVKYSGRAPDDCVLLRVFIGGACQSGLLRLSRWELGQLAAREVAGLLGITGEPIVRRVVRQQQAMPQYHVGHRQRVERVDARLKRFPTLALAGSGLYGVGVPRCVESAESAAEQILQQMSLLNQSNQRVPLRRSNSNRKKEVVG